MNPPKSGWDSFWNNINQADILTIPDPSETGCEPGGLDSISYVVEINYEKTYRTYRNDANSIKCNGAEQLQKIGDIFAQEFDDGKGICETMEWIPCARQRRITDNK